MAVKEWATDATWSTGVDSGDPTKVEMSEALRAQGFVPGVPIGANEINYELSEITKALIPLQNPAIEFHIVGTSSDLVVATNDAFRVLHRESTDTYEMFSASGTLTVGGDGNTVQNDANAYNAGTVPEDAAYGAGDRTFLLQANAPGFQTHPFGEAFPAVTGDLTSAQDPSFVFYDATNDQMIILGGGDEFIALAAGAFYGSFTVPVGPLFGNSLGFRSGAAIGSTILISGTNGDDNRAFTFDGVSVVTGTGALPTVAGGTPACTLVATSQFFFWGQQENTGAEFCIYRSADGVSWDKVYTLTYDGFMSQHNLRMIRDPYSDAVYFVGEYLNSGGLPNSTSIVYSRDQGVSWSVPVKASGEAEKYAAAGGYLWYYNGTTNELRRTTLRLPQAS